MHPRPASALALLLFTGACSSLGPEVEWPLDTGASAAVAPGTRYPGWPRTTWDDYDDLGHRHRSPAVAPAGAAPEASGGNPVKGRELAFLRSRGGGCVACHVLGSSTPETPGNVGPDLSMIGASGRSDRYLFDYIEDPRRFNASSVMPPWGAHRLYSAAEIRDMVAFLQTLRTRAALASALDDPSARHKPAESRDALDPFVNPGVEHAHAGRALFTRAGPTGKACNSCHERPDEAFARWAATMPRWEPRLGKVLGVEEFILRHAKATTGSEYPLGGSANTDLSAFLHAIAWGRPIHVDVTSPPAREAWRLGRTLYEAKIGQLNFSCADCHDAGKGAGKWIRGQYLGEARGQLDHYPAWRTSRSETWDVRKRMQWCNVQIRANDLPPDAPEYGALELYLKAESQGLPLAAPNIRH